MHNYGPDIDELAWRVVRYAMNRVREDPPLDGPSTPEHLASVVGETITADGIGGEVALRIFDQHLSTACISVDHPRYLSFIPGAPTEAAVLFDLVVGASSLYGRFVVGGIRRGVRREPGPGLDSVAGRTARHRGRGVRAGRFGGQLVGPGGGTTPRSGPGPGRSCRGACARRASIPRSTRPRAVMDIDVVVAAVDADGASDR